MGQLILYDAQGIEVGRRDMDPNERYFYYRAYDANERITYAGQQYRLISLAWRIPEEDLRCQVVCEGPVPVVYDDE